MADSDRQGPVAPKQKELTRCETITSFNAWQGQLLYVLSFNKSFAPFLVPGCTWAKYSSVNPHRGFEDDAATVVNGLTRAQKVRNLDLFLGQIANYAPIISRNQITKNSVSLDDIWKRLKEHYGIQTSGGKFIDLVQIRLNPGERYEDLYQRILAFFEDNLLTVGCGLTHHGVGVTVSEELTPSMENMVVLSWLEKIHVGLPGLVKQKYGAELRNRTLASLKSEISAAMESLLTEVSSADGANSNSRVMRASAYNNNSSNSRQRLGQQRSVPLCTLCNAEKRKNTSHWLSACPFLPEGDRRRFQQGSGRGNSRMRQVGVDGEEIYEEDEEEVDDYQTENNPCFVDAPAVHRRVTTRRSPHLECFFNRILVSVCLDTGAESNLVSNKFVTSVGIPVHPATQGAVQADAKTPMGIVGAVKGVILSRGPHKFLLDALVSEKDIGDVIGGKSFLEDNDIAVRPILRRSAVLHLVFY